MPRHHNKRWCRICPDHVEHHAVSPEGSLDPAHYCVDHRCPELDGEHYCTNPKKKNERECFKHAKCKYLSGCPNLARTELQIYCSKHECISPDCHHPIPTDSKSNYCSKHSPHCHFERPNKTQCLETNIEGFQYCTPHRCSKENCNNKAIARKKTCEFHRSCRIADCPLTRAEKKTGDDYEEYCYLHLRGEKCHAEPCDKKAPWGYEYCQNHLCGFRDCKSRKLEKSPSENQFCAAHTCTWTYTTEPSHTLCNMPVHSFRVASSSWCYQHLCAEEGCGNKARDPKGYCSEKHACSTLPCPRRAKHGIPGVTRYCDLHICKKDGCVKEGQYSTRKSFCRDSHACREPKCDEQRHEPARNYCKTHECNNRSCGEKARRGGKFCIEGHSCTYHEGCDLPRILSPSSTTPTTFCVEHKCKEDGCSEEGRNPPKSFCARTHACKSVIEPSCPEKRATSESSRQSVLCKHHQCQSSECMEAGTVRDGYCASHKCSNDACNKPQYKRSPTGLCEDEYYKETLDENSRLKKEAEEKTEEKATEEKQESQAHTTEITQQQTTEYEDWEARHQSFIDNITKTVYGKILADLKRNMLENKSKGLKLKDVENLTKSLG